ncbi:hypothetical protein [Chlamydia sp. 17-3921]|uniref:hypothetical protein n=1 Tax=Chlamydia sp. 17-3921 TaxID=2675798 RepID=UPI001917EA1E|nr:hypothetical protein [Chlamydia sp. 17-3921]
MVNSIATQLQENSQGCLDRFYAKASLLTQVSRVSLLLSIGFAVTTAMLYALSSVPTPVSLIVCAVLTISLALISITLALFVKCFHKNLKVEKD